MCHEYDSRDSGYRLDRRWMRGEDHGNPLPIALFILTWSYCSIYSDMEAKPESAEEEKDQRPDSRQAFFFVFFFKFKSLINLEFVYMTIIIYYCVTLFYIAYCLFQSV